MEIPSFRHRPVSPDRLTWKIAGKCSGYVKLLFVNKMKILSLPAKFVLLAVLLTFSEIQMVGAQTVLSSNLVSSGGSTSSASSNLARVSIGQPCVGLASTASGEAAIGFWYT